MAGPDLPRGDQRRARDRPVRGLGAGRLGPGRPAAGHPYGPGRHLGGAGAAVAFAVLGVLLVADVLTFEQQVGPVIGTIVVTFGWLLTVNLVGHRTRTLPRAVTRTGMLLAVAYVTGMVVVGAGYVLSAPVGPVVRVIGLSLGGPGWLALPLYPLLLAARVFVRPDPATATPPADRKHLREGVRS